MPVTSVQLLFTSKHKMLFLTPNTSSLMCKTIKIDLEEIINVAISKSTYIIQCRNIDKLHIQKIQGTSLSTTLVPERD